jgi:hypothetical protein
MTQAENILSSPVKIGSLTLKNRMVMAPMAVHAPQPDGRPSEQTLADQAIDVRVRRHERPQVRRGILRT